MAVDKKDAIAASFGNDTMSQRAAAVRLFDTQEGFTEENSLLKQEPVRTTSTAKKTPKDKPENEVQFKTKPISIGRGVSIPTDKEATDDVRMKDGFLVRGVPKSATKAEIYEQYNKANGFSSVRGYSPGIIQKTGDFISDVSKALKVNSGSTPTVALSRALFEADEALTPNYDSNGTFQGFRKMSKKETAESRDLASENYAKAIRAPDEGSAADITGKVAVQFMDPINLSVLAVGGAVNTWARFTKIFSAEAVLGATTEIAEQTNEGKDLDEVDQNKVILRAGIQGLAAAGLDKTFGFWQAAKIASKGSDKQLNKSLNLLEDEVTKNVRKGYPDRQAKLRALESVGMTFKSVKKATDKLNREVDLSGKNLSLLPNRIKAVTGINKIHVPKGLEKLVTPMSSVLRDINARLFGRLRRHDFEVAKMEGDAYRAAQSFLARGQKGLIGRTLNASGVSASGIKGNVKLLNGRVVNAEQHLKGLVLNGDARQVKKLGQDINDPLLYPSYLRVRGELDRIQKQMVDLGLLDKGVKDFFPRIVKDVEGLKKALGKEQEDAVTNALTLATKKKGAPLDATEESAIINRFITGRSHIISAGRKISSGRTVDVVPSKLLPFYDDINTSLVRYIDDTSKMIARKRFFGDHTNSSTTINDSIADLVQAEKAKGHMLGNQEELDVLHSLLESRFVHGTQGPGKFIQNTRNIFYTSTLGQLTSAATQLADPAIGAFLNGVGNTLRAAAKSNRKVIPEDFNLTRKIAEDFAGTKGTAKVLSNVLHTTGFKFVDRMGKTVNMNAAIMKAEKQVLSKAGLREFRKEWAPVFGKETDKLIKELQVSGKGGAVSENVKLLAFNKLADAQPISLSEMPQNYLNMTNGRVLYALNTFTIKQLDLVRRNAFREMLHGNSTKGTANLLKFSMLFGGANYGVSNIKDMMRGREDDSNPMSIGGVEVSHKVVESLYRNFGTSEYIVQKGYDGNLQEAVVSTILPITSIIGTGQKAAGTVHGLVTGAEDWGKQMHLLSNNIPLGQLFYDWFGGGIEEFREKQDKRNEAEFLKELKGDEEELGI